MKIFVPSLILLLSGLPLSIQANPSPEEVSTLARHFFRPPDAYNTQVCPRGRYLLYLGFEETDDKRRLYSLDLRTLNAEEKTVRFRYDVRPDMNLNSYYFADKDHVVYTTQRANRYTFGHFISPTDLSGGREVSWNDIGAASQLDLLVTEPRNALFTQYRTGNIEKADPFPDVIKVDLHDGSYKRIIQNPGNIENWITDDLGNIRIGSFDTGDSTGYIYRASHEDDWAPLDLKAVFPEEEREDKSISPLDFLADEDILVCAVVKDENYAGFQLVNIRTMQTISKPLFRPPYGLDDGTFIRHHANRAIIGYSYFEEKREAIYFDAGYRQLQASVNAAIPNLDNYILGFTEDGQYAIIASTGDVQPGVISTLSMKDGTLMPIQVRSPWIDRERLSPMQPVSFPARDGEFVHAYLTPPADGTIDEGKPYPLITIVHGGPGERDTWRYSAEVQFFAALGFGVLQVNYRGSTGYGSAYKGKSMLVAAEKGVLDVADGVRWAVEQGYADPDNLFIYGASFGGYSTAMSLIEEPELYSAGAAAMGVYDWVMIKEEDEARNYAWADDLFSDMDERMDEYLRWSPRHHAGKIQRPIMVLHGGLDQRVNIKQARRFRDALEEADTDYTYHATHWMAHGFMQVGGKEQLAYYSRIASFFIGHLK